MFNSLKKLFGSKQDRDVKIYQPVVDQVNDIFPTLAGLSNDELRAHSTKFRERIAEHLSRIDEEVARLRKMSETEKDLAQKTLIFDEIDDLQKQRNEELEVVLKEIQPEAFAVVKETARRFTEESELRTTATEHDRKLAKDPKKTYLRIDGEDVVYATTWDAAGGKIDWAMVHYDVQLIGGQVLHDGKVAEMATGEGKTLVATLPAYLNGLSGQGVHVITVNDYLAQRDAEWVGPIMEFLMLTIDCLDKHRPNSDGRREAYRADITYGTNNEFGFDYLRDNMSRTQEDKVQRRHHYAMIDEVDSVLIDDARTPLIISGPITQGADDQDYQELKPHIEKLVAAQRKIATKYLTEAKKLAKEGYIGVEDGEAGMALLRAHRALPKNRPLIKFLGEEGMRVLLQKADNTYMAENNKRMHEVDAELLFTIDEKNRVVDLTEMGTEFLSRYNDDERFFIMPDIAGEMAEIDNNEELTSEEKQLRKNKLAQDFAIKSKRLHAINQLLKAYTLFERDDEYVVMDNEVKIVDEQTGRMMEGRRYSDGLHQALEAKENVKIGDLTQTYATITLQNYFRMYHKLSGMTGTAETEAGELWEIYKLDVVVIPTNRPIQRADDNDLIYKTEREKINALIDEITRLSQAGRPVLVGTTSVEVSEKLSRVLNMRNVSHNVLNAKQHQREAEIVAEAGVAGNVTIATNMAGRGTDIKISEEVKRAGGLAIVGTERHDSRRVDRQLRGRSGRQGDPGSSLFYVSLEDKLMRYFQSDRIAKIMDKMGLKEGEVIQAGMVTKSIERAQKKVEENNFGIRKRLLEYDDVMNIQREAIYRKRNNALAGDRLSVDLDTMFNNLIYGLVEAHRANGSSTTFKQACIQVLGFDPELDDAAFSQVAEGTVAEQVYRLFTDFYQRKMRMLVDRVMPQVRHAYETDPDRYKRIMIPFTDGSSHPLRVTADIEEGVKTNGESIIRDIEQAVTLAIIDDKWKEHLRSMDDLKESSRAASFEQKDPLVVYKMEAYNLFEELVYEINQETTSYLAKGDLFFSEEQPRVREAKQPARTNFGQMRVNRTGDDDGGGTETQRAAQRAGEAAGRAERQPVETFVRTEKKVGRNDPCPCGSGKKFKKCHGA